MPWRFFSYLGIEQFQIVQDNYEEVVIKLVLDREYSKERLDEITKEILNRYRPIFGEDLDIIIEFVNHIATTRVGKMRVVISNLPTGEVND